MRWVTSLFTANVLDDVLFSITAEAELLLLLHPFNGPFSRTACVSRYKKSKTSPDLNESRDNGVFRKEVASGGPYANNLHLAPDR